MNPTPRELISPSFTFEDNASMHLKILLMNAVFFITFFVSFVFFIINTFLVYNYTLAFFDISIVLTMIYALYLLHVKHNYVLPGQIGSVTHFILFTSIVLTQKGEAFTLIWTYFYAPFAMVSLNAKRGLVISLLFLTLIFIITATGVGEWQQGMWDMTSYLRFILAHLVMLYVMYTIFYANEKANERIEILRQNEKKQLELLKELSLTDPLTGLRNRRSMQARFEELTCNTHAEQTFFAFFLLDVDHFKEFNDTYGHQQGDKLLVKIALAMKYLIGNENVFRIGGDEFAGIVTAQTKEKIMQTLTTLRRKIISLQLDYETRDIQPHATVTIGVHIVTDGNYDFSHVFKNADIALYRAKAQGRDQIQAR